MAIIKKFNPNQIYITKKLENRLKSLYDYPVTIIEAPTGYGKTTAVKEFLKASGKQLIWFNVDSVNREQAYNDFCLKIMNINETAAKKLMLLGCPVNDAAVKSMVSILSDISYIDTTMFVIDNYHYVADNYLDLVITDLAGSLREDVHAVILTQAVKSNGSFELIMSKRINYISKNDFEFEKNDIIQYYKLCGIKLEDAEADFLYGYTEGWVSALYLQMLSFEASNTFEMTADMENLIGKAIWNNLDRASRDFLVSISVFGSFTLRQCIYISDGRLSDDEIEGLLNTSGFIRYEAKEGKYYIHSILKYFLESVFEKQDIIFRREIIKKAGDWCRDNELYASAIEFYYKNKDYESVLSMSYDSDVLYEIYTGKSNRVIFMDITTYADISLKKKYLSSYILFLYFLFLDNERDYFERELEIVYDIIQNEYKNAGEGRELLGEYYVLKGFLAFNSLKEMNENFVKAYELLKRPSRVLSRKISLMLYCPSPLCLYHSRQECIEDEARDIENIMPVYYRLTDGQSKGVEALFKAEMLLLRGELDDALKLCEKAVYMSTSRKQTDVYISAVMSICRIAYLKGDADMLKINMQIITDISQTSGSLEIMVLCDMCMGFINISINNEQGIPSWLKESHTIEKRNRLTGLGFSNVIYGKYLIVKEKYTKLLSISGQMLNVAGIYNNVIYKIYTLIYMAIAKNQTGEEKKAGQLLKEAIELSASDGIYIPFAENYNMLVGIFSSLSKEAQIAEFIKGVSGLSKIYARSIQSVEKNAAKEQKYGLTKRETEVARLAAKRLSNKEIAEQLFIAESTVKSNLKGIFNKMGINSRNELKNYF